MNGLAERYEHPEHVPVFLDFDDKTGSIHHIERQEGRKRLNNLGRKGSLLPDDEYQAIRMAFPTRGDSIDKPQTVSRNVPVVVLTPPQQATSGPRQHPERCRSPRPRGPRAPSRVASSAQLRVSPAPSSARQRTKSAVNGSELRSPAPFRRLPPTPQINGVSQTASSVRRS